MRAACLSSSFIFKLHFLFLFYFFFVKIIDRHRVLKSLCLSISFFFFSFLYPPHAGGLRIDSCNIYGQMYRVGRIIDELSGPCVECKCTEIGVNCVNLKCWLKLFIFNTPLFRFHLIPYVNYYKQKSDSFFPTNSGSFYIYYLLWGFYFTLLMMMMNADIICLVSYVWQLFFCFRWFIYPANMAVVVSRLFLFWYIRWSNCWLYPNRVEYCTHKQYNQPTCVCGALLFHQQPLPVVCQDRQTTTTTTANIGK